MATLREYFVKDARNLTVQETWPIANIAGENLGEVTARLHLDFDANAKYVSFYFPKMDGMELPEAMALNNVDRILRLPAERVLVTVRWEDEKKDANDLVFTGQIYLYSERPVPPELKGRLIEESKAKGHHLIFRSTEYMEARNKFEKPRDFIAHDSRDKKAIAEPIALQLQRWMCPVWFDQYSLKVGDSLRASIEQGLKDRPKCILVLTPNFLSNEGWTRREYDAVFTKELVEKKRVILPVWHDVKAEDVYKFSPTLADRVGAQWSEGIESVCRKLLVAVDEM